MAAALAGCFTRINITAPWAVDREFFDIYLVPLTALGCLWGVFGSLWDALESLWLSFGAPLAFPWVLWGKLWILSKIGRPIPSKWAVSLQPADKIEPRGTRETQLRLSTFIYVCIRLLRLPTFATFPTQQVLLRASFLHAPGARMTVVELTPSK